MNVMAQIRMRNAEHMAARFHEVANIYFIQCDNADGFIKIGWAEDPKRRLATFQVSCPYPLKIIATMSGGFKDERALNDRFKDARIRGEWFKPTPELMEFIETCQR